MTTETAATPEQKEKVIDSVEEVSEFQSMCGSGFDPNKAATCFMTCQEDNPEEFAACQANHSLQQSVSKAKPKRGGSSKGKTIWGHLKGCQGGLIDEMLSEKEGPFTIEEIMAHSGGTRYRVLSHIKHLYTNCGAVIRKTADGKLFAAINNSEGLVGILSDGVKIFNEDGTPYTAKA